MGTSFFPSAAKSPSHRAASGAAASSLETRGAACPSAASARNEGSRAPSSIAARAVSRPAPAVKPIAIPSFRAQAPCRIGEPAGTNAIVATPSPTAVRASFQAGDSASELAGASAAASATSAGPDGCVVSSVVRPTTA